MMQKNGFIFLEVLIAITLIGIVCVPLSGIIFQFINLSVTLQKTAQANALIKEEAEAVRSFRDGTTWATNGLGSSSIVPGNVYHMALNSGAWVVASNSETVGDFSRQVVFSQDASWDNTVSSADMRKVTVSVVGAGKTYQVVFYLTNWNQ